MSLFTVDREKCKRDGICVATCPDRVIELKGDGFPRPTPDAEERCETCGQCVAVCPQGALSLNWLKVEDCPPIRPELALSPEQAEQFLRSRRSIRSFKDRPVEWAKLEKLLEIAGFAPSADNNQTWHWVVIEDQAEVDRLAGLVIDWMRLTMTEDPQMAEDFQMDRVAAAWEGGDEQICRHAPHLIIAHGDKEWSFGCEDCTLALSYLELFAPAIGLGACWAGYLYTAINAYPPLAEALDLPADHKAYGALMIGYPVFKYHRLPLRNQPRVNWK